MQRAPQDLRAAARARRGRRGDARRRSLTVILATSFGAGVAGVAAGSARAQITFGQLDDFEDGTTQGWVHSLTSPNPPVNMPDGGPQGTGDNYLHNVSTGEFGAGGRQIIYNQAQWIGDFTAAGVTRLSAFMNNLGTTDLHMRVAVQGGALATRFSSASAVLLPPGSGWQQLSFDVTPATMTNVGGGESFATVISSVNTFRIVSAQNPSYMGDQIAATLGVDNIRALRLPGDANFDGNVNLTDFNILASNFGTSSGATWQDADFDFNGNVNLSDFNLLAANFGQTISGPDVTPDDWNNLASAVPEPAAGIAALLGAVTLLARHPRRSP